MKKKVDYMTAVTMLTDRINYFMYRRGETPRNAVKMGLLLLGIEMPTEVQESLVKTLQDQKLDSTLKEKFDEMMDRGEIEIEGVSDREYEDLKEKINSINKGSG